MVFGIREIRYFLFRDTGIFWIFFRDCTAQQCLPIGQNVGECYVFNAIFIGVEETSSYWSVHFDQFFPCFSLEPSMANLVGLLG